MSMEQPQYVPREQRREGGDVFDVADGEYWCRVVSASEETLKDGDRALLIKIEVGAPDCGTLYYHYLRDNASFDARHSDVLDTFGIPQNAGRLYSRWHGATGRATFEHYTGKDKSVKCRMKYPNPHIQPYVPQEPGRQQSAPVTIGEPWQQTAAVRERRQQPERLPPDAWPEGRE